MTDKATMPEVIYDSLALTTPLTPPKDAGEALERMRQNGSLLPQKLQGQHYKDYEVVRASLPHDGLDVGPCNYDLWVLINYTKTLGLSEGHSITQTVNRIEHSLAQANRKGGV